ncbi:MAG: hypothetical protein R2822_13830 [Spirosomataceae bacterium]
MRILLFVLMVALLMQCQTDSSSFQSIQALLENVEKLKGRAEYIHSPYVTAGDRLYMVGHQDGSFPDLGWHITGEMGDLGSSH